jgi:hypothetical protein
LSPAVVTHLLLISFSLGEALAPRPNEHSTPYKLVLEAVLPALSQGPRDFIVARQLAIEDAVAAPSLPASTNTSAADDSAGHFLLLDVAAADADAAGRMLAAAQFPHSKKDARKLFETHGIKTGGDLPWLLEEHFAKLVQVFRNGDAAAAERQIGLLIHLATDAAMPFNTTTLAGDELESREPPHGAQVKARRLRQRFHGVFIHRLQDRLAYEVRVSPARVQRVSSPIQAAFDTLLESHRVSQELAAIDMEAIRRLGMDDVTAFASSADIYFASLAERVAPLLENQLESGALLAASLIDTAWTTARPSFAAAPSSAATAAPPVAPRTIAKNESPEANRAPAATAAPTTSLVGSLSSTVYHRNDCSHVARIKAENRVEFKTKA